MLLASSRDPPFPALRNLRSSTQAPARPRRPHVLRKAQFPRLEHPRDGSHAHLVRVVEERTLVDVLRLTAQPQPRRITRGAAHEAHHELVRRGQRTRDLEAVRHGAATPCASLLPPLSPVPPGARARRDRAARSSRRAQARRRAGAQTRGGAQARRRAGAQARRRASAKATASGRRSLLAPPLPPRFAAAGGACSTRRA